jgi:ubiquinone/menaquinone biosynthesis C-methylase UbiE
MWTCGVARAHHDADRRDAERNAEDDEKEKQETDMSEARLFVATTFTEIYERVLVGPLFRPFAEQLVGAVAPRRGDSVLDVACGTGIVARVARENLGSEARIVGVDVAPAMLAVARTVDPTIDWREGNATSLPLGETEGFSVVTCHQGLQFMPDKPAALREMRRALAPGGRVAISNWSSLSGLPEMVALNTVAERHVGPIADPRHSFGDIGALKNLVIAAGFTGVNVETFRHDVQFADGTLFARLNAMAVIGMSDKGPAMSEAERGELAGRIAVESQDVIARLTKNGVFVLPLATNVAIARV